MSQPVDLVVDRRVLLDVGVGGGDVGLGLVVVVVADEVFDPVVGEELAELVGELGRQRLVGGDDQGGLLDLLDGPGDGGALAGPGDAEEGLEAVAPLDPLGQCGDRRRLVTGRNVQMQCTFLQYNRDTFEFASGGGTWVQLQTRQTWLATTAYTLNQIREPTTDNTLIYKVTTAGTSAGTQPTWPLVTGATVTDGSVVWTCMGLGDTEVYEFLPAEPETLDRRRIGWEWRDGAKVERVTLSKGIVTGGEAIQYRRSQANQMQVTFQIEGQSGVKPYRKIDNFSAVIA